MPRAGLRAAEPVARHWTVTSARHRGEEEAGRRGSTGRLTSYSGASLSGVNPCTRHSQRVSEETVGMGTPKRQWPCSDPREGALAGSASTPDGTETHRHLHLSPLCPRPPAAEGLSWQHTGPHHCR